MKSIRTLAAAGVAAAVMGFAVQGQSTVLFTAGVDSSGMVSPISVPAGSNPHIPSIAPGATLTPAAPILLDGVATGPLHGITYGPGAFDGSTGGTTGFVNVSYTATAADVGLPLFIEVANVGDGLFQSGLALDNVRVNGALVESFESGVPVSWTTAGFVTTSAAVANLAPTDGSSFLFMDTTAGGTSAVFDTVDGTNGANLFASLGLAVGDVLSFDIAFMTTDGTDTYHDYGLAALGVPQVVVPEPSDLGAFAVATLGLIWARRRRKPV